MQGTGTRERTDEGYIYIGFRPAEDYFAVRIHNDNMRALGIVQNSIVVCRKQSTANNNEVIIALLNGETVVRRYIVRGGSEYLVSENNKDYPEPITPQSDLIILGKVVELRTALV